MPSNGHMCENGGMAEPSPERPGLPKKVSLAERAVSPEKQEFLRKLRERAQGIADALFAAHGPTAPKQIGEMQGRVLEDLIALAKDARGWQCSTVALMSGR